MEESGAITARTGRHRPIGKRARRAWRGGVLTAAFLAAAAAAPPGAHAQQGREFGALVNRIDRLERDIQVLQRQVYRGGAPPPGASAPAASADISEGARYRADLEVRLDQLEGAIASARGRNEELAHGLDQLKSRLDKLQSDIDLRLSALEKAAGIAPGGAASAAPAAQGPAPPAAASAAPPSGAAADRPGPGAPPRPLGTLPQSAVPKEAPPEQPAETKTARLPRGTPHEQYEFARSLLLKQDFAGAESAFKAFLAAHPKDALAGNAQYWLGETFYVRQNFQQAAFAFAEGIEKYPKSRKAPDSLLKLGMSLARLDKTAQACTALQRLGENFPHATATVKRRAASEQQRLKCKG